MSFKKYAHKLNLRFLFCSLILLLFIIHLNAQAPVLNVTNSYTQQSVLYNSDTFAHTAWKPVVYTNSAYQKADRSWLHRKFFEEHLLQVQQPGFNIFGDFVFDEDAGATKRAVPTISSSNQNHDGTTKFNYINTRGYFFGGNVGDKFYFETDFYENQASFAGYVDSFIRKTGVIPFQNSYKNLKAKGFDYSYSTAKLVYTPNKYLLFNLGYGTNFIGDGYRSLLLSDYNTPYPYFRTSINIGSVQYSVMYSQYISNENSFTYAEGYPRKWGQTYLVDWHATKNFNIGIFDAVVSSIENVDHEKDFGVTHFSPVIFLHSSKSPSGLKNNDVLGLNLKYTIIPAVDFYAQVMLDNSGSEDWEKRYGYQIGIRAGNLFKIDGLNAQAEFNTVRPYSYASDTITTVYAHDGQSLAHPLGANFKEGVFVADYSYKRWWFRAEAMAARYGNDSSSAAENFGRDIFKPLYTHSKTNNVSTDQGLLTKLYYGDIRIAYILNRKTNMRVETGAVFRSEKNKLDNYKDVQFYIGIRMSFRKLIYDF
ncbi:MAG: hypothetical protein JO072_03060 [Parafilimonas sp.]|nr:hypothetical protein [Parafilimonas sp.]